MGWKKLAFIISLSFLLVNCISFYHHPKGGFRPKKPKFSLAKEQFIYSNKIDTIAIYTRLDTLKYGKNKSVSFLKLYNNGRQFESNMDVNSLITKSTFRPLDIGYYIIKKDSIYIENFIVNPMNKYDTKYVKETGVIKKDTIFLNNRFIKEKKDIYVKQKLNFIPEPANW